MGSREATNISSLTGLVLEIKIDFFTALLEQKRNIAATPAGIWLAKKPPAVKKSGNFLLSGSIALNRCDAIVKKFLSCGTIKRKMVAFFVGMV
ncbi:MAG TPA: hypothetical protein ENJ23_02565 [Bacteroidetes bacterium]|nr:hypothetical protein [Bacteroidota bacterium]